MSEFDQKAINTIRMLAVDGVQKANSGHPGMPMGAAPMAYVLWTRYLKHNPHDPKWIDRDRFILSAGHGSMLLYSLLHLTGYDLPLEQLQQFRQWGSLTPGHPEYGQTVGVEVTTGPLGQGFTNGVGMAIAEAHLAATLNTPAHKLIDHYTYAIVSDGDLMEGITSEAASLAGHLKLGKLIYLYDDNHISIEGSTGQAFTEDVGARFAAYDWHVQRVADGNDIDAIDAAIRAAQAVTDKPSLIMVRTTIGYGSPNKAGSAKSHGEPLGVDEVKATKEALGWPLEPAFLIPGDVMEFYRQAVEKGSAAQAAWQQELEAWKSSAAPEQVAAWDSMFGDLPGDWTADLPDFADAKPVATRVASGQVMNALAPHLPGFMGGSADLEPSTKTELKGMGWFSPETPEGRNLHFGVREHAMGGIANGMAVHGGLIPYTATFLIFSDYMRPTIRLAALSHYPTIFVFTHDSIGLGEDGPTHQPIEQTMSLRLIPHLEVIRPADAKETAGAWVRAIKNAHTGHATVLLFTRQNLPVLDLDPQAVIDGVDRGAYVVSEADGGQPDAILIGTGSEVEIAMNAQKLLAERGVKARVVSMPNWASFEAQPQDYQDSVLPPQVKARVAIEAGVTTGWEKWVGTEGAVVGVDRFGASAPYKQIYAEFGLTAAAVAEQAQSLLEKA
ncbi:MAG TPA: transketolase [Aggregatilinea sp.]|uniref:transketolase n=1 Tax=Aggregatilinea sp. TaxID=2806333 RepID=UPI002B59691B|nr:transketolase [Aggregatilinea sp.]HML21794.1 transketolase [Aggregatilinea sp.]